MKILLLLPPFLLSLTLQAQVDLSQKISLHVDAVSLDSVFQILHAHHHVRLAFGIDNIPAHTKITLHAHNQTLHTIIQSICHQSELSFQIIGNSIVFKYTKPITPKLPVSKQIESTPPFYADHKVSQDSSQTSLATPLPDSTLASIPDSSQLVFHHLTDTVITSKSDTLPLPLPLQNSMLYRKRKRFLRLAGTGLYANYALDFNQFHFQQRDFSAQEFTPEKNHSVGIGAYTVFHSKLYLSLGIGYATRNFLLAYNYQVLDPSDPMPIPDQTKVQLTYFEIPITMGYNVYSKKRLSIWMSTGFYPSYLTDKKETTTYLNKGNPDTEYFLNTNQSSLSSLTLGFITHYYVFNRWGIFVEAGYLYCLDKVNTEVMESNTTTYRIKSGIHFSMQSKTKNSRI